MHVESFRTARPTTQTVSVGGVRIWQAGRRKGVQSTLPPALQHFFAWKHLDFHFRIRVGVTLHRKRRLMIGCDGALPPRGRAVLVDINGAAGKVVRIEPHADVSVSDERMSTPTSRGGGGVRVVHIVVAFVVCHRCSDFPPA